MSPGTFKLVLVGFVLVFAWLIYRLVRAYLALPPEDRRYDR
jgi:flagellar biogenesis protein FliO